MHLARFESRMMWKQTVKNELNNVDITKAVKLQNAETT